MLTRSNRRSDRAIRVLLTALVLTATLSLPVAGAATLRGKVIDSLTSLPIDGATIRDSAGKAVAVSDVGGNFTLEHIALRVIELEVTHIGYLADRFRLAISADSMHHHELRLRPATLTIDGIRVIESPRPEDEFSTARSISVASRLEMQARSGSNTADVLREESAILIQKTTHGHGTPIMRGLIGKHVLLLYDGIRLNRSTFRHGGNQYLNTVDVAALGRIELARGPFSLEYGSDAIGGTVNLLPIDIERETENNRLLTTLEGRYATADEHRSMHLSLAGQLVSLAGRLGLSVKKVGNLTAGGDIGEQDPTGWSEVDANAHLLVRLDSATSIRLDYLNARQEEVPRYDEYASGEFEAYVYDPQNRDLAAVTLGMPIAGSSVWKAKGCVSYQREIEGRRIQRSGSAVVNNEMDEVHTWGGYLRLHGPVTENIWFTSGSELYRERVRSARIETSGVDSRVARPTYPDNSSYLSSGFYLKAEIQPFPRLTLNCGTRYSYFEVDSELPAPFGEFQESYRDLTGSLNLRYAASPSLNLVGGWSRGFRAPNLNDLVVLKYSSSGVDAPSSGLRPEYSNNFEIGLKLHEREIRAGAFVFYNQLDDLLDRYPGEYDGKTWFDENGNGVRDSSEPDVYQRRNVARSRVYGWEAELWIPLGTRWQLRANAAWTWGENQTDHEPLSRVPPLMGMINLGFAPHPSLQFEAFARLAGDQRRLSQRDLDDSRIDNTGTPGWATFNLRAKWRLRDLQLNLVLENLLNTGYKEHGSGIYAPGLNVMISASYSPAPLRLGSGG
jgi:outer membrane receptor protein involved in Fe transport